MTEPRIHSVFNARNDLVQSQIDVAITELVQRCVAMKLINVKANEVALFKSARESVTRVVSAEMERDCTSRRKFLMQNQGIFILPTACLASVLRMIGTVKQLAVQVNVCRLFRGWNSLSLSFCHDDTD